MNEYTLTTELEVEFCPPGAPDEERDVAYPMVEISYRYLPGCGPFTPPGEYAPIDPPDPPEVDFIGAKMIERNGAPIEVGDLQTVARNWFYSDAGVREAINCAEESRRPDPDEAYERARDDAEWDRQYDRQSFDDEC